jgi:hypothetical protein
VVDGTDAAHLIVIVLIIILAVIGAPPPVRAAVPTFTIAAVPSIQHPTAISTADRTVVVTATSTGAWIDPGAL